MNAVQHIGESEFQYHFVPSFLYKSLFDPWIEDYRFIVRNSGKQFRREMRFCLVAVAFDNKIWTQDRIWSSRKPFPRVSMSRDHSVCQVTNIKHRDITVLYLGVDIESPPIR